MNVVFQREEDIDDPLWGVDPDKIDKVKKLLEPKYESVDRALPSQINNYMYLGGWQHATSPDLLKVLGITHVLNMVSDDIPEEHEAFKYLQISSEDDETYAIVSRHLQKCIDFINDAKKNSGIVLVHCMAGMNRSATMCVGYLIREEKKSFLTALRECHKARPIILNNMGFVAQLYLLAEEHQLLDPEEEWAKL